MRTSHNFKDLVGQRFGKRIVISRAETPIYGGKKGSSRWVVQCDCGRISTAQTCDVKRGKSCGCDLSYAIKSGATRRKPLPLKSSRNKSHLMRRFCLTVERFEQMILDQNNRCKICDKEFTVTPSVDHDHLCCPGHRTCGNCIRGLLCNLCNAGLGSLGDNKALLQKAIGYLTEYEHQSRNRISQGSI